MTSAADIADALGRPRPTAQQVAVIESGLVPALVVAGAGSGKTETMANRVLWLLANELVLPSEVLGLTFTRKAAGELSARIRERIAELARVGLLPGSYDPFEAPTVATYNSFANSIFRDNAVLLGRESDGSVLGEAGAWQLARRVVTRSRDARLPDLSKGLEPVTRAVLGLSRAMAENDVPTEDVRDFARRFRAIADLPNGTGGAFAWVVELAQTVGSLDILVDLAADFQAEKVRRGLIEYSDQVALSLQIVRLQPRIADEERARFRVVLLDEYQDTSVTQTWLLAELFAGHPVMAVGDPNQSIYGWRGASANNLDAFAGAFGASDSRFALSTSWRNGHRILEAANHLVAPFEGVSRTAVQRLVPGPTASAEPVESLFAETVVDEAESVAQWLAARLGGGGASGTPPSAALLLRTRKNQAVFLEKLREAGVPFHVLGLGGLVSEPEIADLVSALTVVSDPGAGLEAIRVLAGSRWRIGARDLLALKGLASRLRDLDYAQHPLDPAVKEKLKVSVAGGEGGSIVDALDFVGTARAGHGFLEAFTEEGVERLGDAGRFFARLRSRASLDLRDFVILVLQELQLDIEVIANEYRPLGPAPVEAFLDALAGYLAIDDSATLRGFLTWLREAEEREDLAPRPEDPEPGTVQVLTIHGAKGLEWDHVVVPRLVVDELPAKPLEGFKGWTSFGQLPWVFRGDGDELPEFRWERATTRKEIKSELDRYSQAVRERSVDEERRLAYVATTRARHGLLLTGSFWAGQKAFRSPSPFLVELAEAAVIPPLPEPPADDVESPLGDRMDKISWPLDPLGRRRASIAAAAAAVRSAEPRSAGRLGPRLDTLLEERRRRLHADGLVPLPTRVPASRFKDYLIDPAGVAGALRRPMPERPYRATQLGTLFHAWVEDRYGRPGGTEDAVGFDAVGLVPHDVDPDTVSTELDAEDPVGGAELARLREVFENSQWADLRPEEVEREIHLPFDGQIVICKIDAVYRHGDRFQVVDWKTGKAPKDAADLEQKQLQLALYRLAYARWRGIDPERVDAVFYFVSDDRVVHPERLFDEAELIARWRAAISLSPST
ncbi:MAG: hypothetical protein RI885_2194 [Actinomycetota bacterium]